MAPNTEKNNMELQGDLELTSGFMKYPSMRDIKLKNPMLWLKGRREDDGVFPYWRVHDKLYDLTSFIEKHPGGSFWIKETQGTDITEAFESSHYGPKAEQLLKKYFAKEIHTQRNSPFTFKEDGFYKTLKRKAIPILNEVGTGPDKNIIFIQDSLLFGVVFFAVLASVANCGLLAAVAGAILSLATGVAHNFFHQRNTWRIYIFDMMLFSSREWRISHALSHHTYTNTIYDYEIAAFEPHFELLPKKNKKFLNRFNRHFFLLTVPLVYVLSLFIDFAIRAILNFRRELSLSFENFIPFIQLILIMILNGSFLQGLWLWFILHASANFFFLLVGLSAAHHHPEIYHEGDTAPVEKDWGIHQVITTRERGELFMKSLFLVSITFGNHTLHHLFPTVDHSKLPHLLPALLETCAEFGIKFEPFTPWQQFKGLFLQIINIKPNKNQPKILK